MFTTAAKSRVACFFNQFMSELYDAGAADAVSAVGLRDPLADLALTQGLAYLSGYCAAARLANSWMTPQWCVCETIERAAGILSAMHHSTDSVDGPAVDRLTHVWTAEIKHELARKAA